MSSNQDTRVGNIQKFELRQAKSGGAKIDIDGAVVDLKYYESVLSNTVSLTTIITETGSTDSDKIGEKGILDGLPVRGGEPAEIVIEDHKGGKLSFTGNNKFYVNRIRNGISGTQKDVYSVDFSPKELFANEQSRVIKRYDGKISENIKTILRDVLKTNIKEDNIDETAINYNFIGNDRKPFYVCTWLASKSIPQNAGSVGGAAGYFFYQTVDGLKFKSIDKLFTQQPKKRYVYTNTPSQVEDYDGKILSYDIERDVDLQNNLTMGAYSNRSLFFDFYSFDYHVRNFSIDEGGSDGSKGKTVHGGLDPIDSVADEFRKPVSRVMNHILDVGTLPSGKNSEEQLATQKQTQSDGQKGTAPTYDAAKTMVQAVMRYNQLFSIKINIMIAGDFTLRAGDLVYCEFPEITVNKNTQVNKQSGGIYMISSLCHNVTPKETLTSLTLVRDSFGRKPFK